MTVSVVPQRIGPNSRVTWTPEAAGAPGVDPGSPAPIVLPTRELTGFTIQQGTQEAPFFALGGNPFGRVYNMLTGSGAINMGLEFQISPYILKATFPSYTKTNLPTGAIHDFYILPPGNPVSFGSGQLQFESKDPTGTNQYLRARNCQPQQINLAYSTTGPANFDATFISTGDYAETDIGGTPSWLGYKAVSMNDGFAKINGITTAGMPNFSLQIFTGAATFGGAFNQGRYTSVNRSVLNFTGSVELAWAFGGSGVELNSTLRDYAKNQTLVPLNCLWANGPIDTMTSFMNVILPTNALDFMTQSVGGTAGLTTKSNFNTSYDATASKTSASIFGTTLGPYLIGATTNVFSVKIDGGSTINVTLTNGAARTAAQIVAELNADSTFAAAATASLLGGYVNITSNAATLKGSATSVQFITATSNNCSAILGFNNTAVAGYDTTCLVRVYNSIQTAYV